MKPRHLYQDSDNIEWPAFNQSQQEFVFDRTPFLLLSGGFGSGKTTALAWKIIMMMVDSEFYGDLSGNVGIAGRVGLEDFKKTTLPEILRWLPKSWIRNHFEKNGVLELVNESILRYTHFDGIDHLQSLNVGFAAIDQMEQLKKEVFTALALERIRLKVLTRYDQFGHLVVPEFDRITGECISEEPERLAAVLKFQTVFGACNPGKSWLKQTFVMNERFKESQVPFIHAKYRKDFKLIESSAYENASNLPDGYIERQKREKSEKEFKRSVLGSWDEFEGQVFSDFTDDLVNKNDKIPHPFWDIYVGVDHGGTGYDSTRRTGVTAIIFVAVEEKTGEWDRVHVFDELDLQGATVEETTAAISEKLTALRMAWKYHFEGIKLQETVNIKGWGCGGDMLKGIQDCSENIAQRYQRYAQAYGFQMNLMAMGAGERERIERMNWMFRKKLIDVNPKCVHLIDSLRNIEYGANEKVKAQQDDHEPEALGYALSVTPIWTQDVSVPRREPTLVERELAKIGILEEEEYTGVYSGYE